MKSKFLKVLTILSFIPFLGYFIAFFAGALKVGSYKMGRRYPIYFMLLSVLCLSIFEIVLYIIFYFLIAKDGIITLTEYIVTLVLEYVVTLCAALVSVVFLKKFLERFKKLEEDKSGNNL